MESNDSFSFIYNEKSSTEILTNYKKWLTNLIEYHNELIVYYKKHPEYSSDGFIKMRDALCACLFSLNYFENMANDKTKIGEIK